MNAFKSTLCSYMKQFVEFKRQQGYSYINQEKRLSRFDSFLQSENYALKVLSVAILALYIEGLSKLSARGRAARLSSVREFSKYLNARFPESSILASSLFKVPETVRFYLFSKQEVCQLMKAAERLGMRDKIRSNCMCFLIGLLYSTGLRIDEALPLTRDDVDLINLRIFIQKGKK